MRADIHPDGTLRIKPESMTEQTALERWREAMQVFDQFVQIRCGALALLAFTPPSTGPASEAPKFKPYTSLLGARTRAEPSPMSAGLRYWVDMPDGKAFTGEISLTESTDYDVSRLTLADINRQAEAEFNRSSGKIAT